MINPTEKAPLAERVRECVEWLNDPMRAYPVSRTLLSIADEIAALERKVEEAREQHAVHVAEISKTLRDADEATEYWRKRATEAQAGLTLTPQEIEMMGQPPHPLEQLKVLALGVVDGHCSPFMAYAKAVALGAIEAWEADRTKAAEGAASRSHQTPLGQPGQQQAGGLATGKSIARSEAGETDPPGADGAAPDAPLTPAQRAFYEAALALAVLLDSHWTEQKRRPEWFNWQEDAIVRAYRALSPGESR